MHKYLSLWLSCLLFPAFSFAQSDWQLVWSDEFDTDGPPDSSVWNFEQGFARNEEAQWYQSDNAVCKGGCLVIEAHKENNRRNPCYEAGPGSFTGLRIGSATAKGLGLALDKPIIPVPTVDGLAYDLWGTDKIVCPIMDARRNQVYTGIYEFCDGKLQILENQMAVSVTEIAEKLNALGREVIFLGDGVPVYRKTLAEVMKIPYSFAPAHMNRQRASAVAVLGAQYYVQGRAESAMEHKPDYLRLSQAERERKEREEQNRA